MLPKNRQIKKLGEVSSVVRGLTYKPDQVRDQSKGIACFRTKNVQSTLDESDIIYIDPVLVKSEEKLLKTGDILVSSANSVELLGKCCLIENLSYKATLGGFICALRYQENIIDYMFLYYHFNSENTQKKLRSFANKTTGIANLPIPKMMDEIQIPLPPLSTQQAIVAKLDQIHAEISANQSAIHQQLAQLDELWQSSLDQIFSNEEWDRVRIEKIFKIKSGDFLPSRSMDERGSFDVFGGNGVVGKHIDYNLDGENIIIGRVGALCGNVRLVFGKIRITDNAFYISEYLIDNLDKEYLKTFLAYINLGNTSNSSAQPVISYKGIKDIKIPLPDLATQKAAVAKLDQIHEHIAQLRADYTAQLEHYEELRDSVLDQAFKGQLVK